MSAHSIEDQLLNAYPKLYYFIPCIRRHQRQFEETTFWFDEPMDAMLWFLDMIALETDSAPCIRSKLKGLVCRWYGREASTAFNRCYRILDKHDFITWEPNQEDSREHDVWITDRGVQLLAQIKEHRLQHLKVLCQVTRSLSSVEEDVMSRVLNAQAELAWTEMMSIMPFQETTIKKRVKDNGGKGRRRPHTRKHSRKRGSKKK